MRLGSLLITLLTYLIKNTKGIINDQFSEIQALKSVCVVQLINAYCVEVGTILSELKSCINLPDVDFSNFAAQAHKIEGKSLGIGAEHVRRACVDLIQACEEKHERKVTRALSWLQAEFSITREKLNSLVKMEQRIIRVESRLIK